MSEHETLIATDPLTWRPQVPLVTRRPLPIRDPIVEPLWSGTRVIVHVDEAGAMGGDPGPTVRLLDAFGVDLAPEEPAIATAIRSAVEAGDAVIDGILTDQATRDGVGMAIIAEPRASLIRVFATQEASVEIERRDQPAEPVEAFVALDLLRLDGESLLDLPLLERKRLLESVVSQSELVRVSVHVRPPVEPWVASWKSAGLKGAMLKGANGRYRPGELTETWRAVTRLASRR